MKDYRWHVFDVDGTLLDSNGVKSRAFYEAALPYGADVANALVEYHQRAGSIGRVARFAYFFHEILGREPEAGEMEGIMHRCTEAVMQGTLTASLLPGVTAYLRSLAGRCAVVSGIDTFELRTILKHHGLDQYFGRVWGGPRTKPLIFQEEAIDKPAIYYGDTEQDFLDARAAGLDFVWVRGCSEWEGMRVIQDFRELS